MAPTSPPLAPAIRVRNYLTKAKPTIAEALPKHIGIDRFFRSCQTAINGNPKITENCTLESILDCVMQAARYGLEPGPLGLAYLIPYGATCTYQIGYKGIMELVNRTKQMEVFNALPVHEKDFLDYEYGFGERLVFKPAEGDRGKVTKFLAYGVIKGGGRHFVVMTKEEALAHGRKYSKSFAKPDSPWQTSPDSMCLKTTILKLAPWLPKTIELPDAVFNIEEGAVPGDFEVVADAPKPEQAPEQSGPGGIF